MTQSPRLSRRAALTLGAASTLPWSASAQRPADIRIGVLNDQSGPYRDISGPVSVSAVRQAARDFGD